ncbi:MAG: hypothetical protein V3V04_02305 [Rhizobiaceae bacterium]
MDRILVIGCAGAGKSTFSKKLAKQTGLPLTFLDQIYWLPGWVGKQRPLFASEIRELIANDKWILDGNYKGTLALRLARADTVIFLDLNRMKCLWHVLLRTMRTLGKVRDDMPEGCPEQFNWEFIKFIWRFPQDYRPILIQRLEGFEGNIVYLKSLVEYDGYLSSIQNRS